MRTIIYFFICLGIFLVSCKKVSTFRQISIKPQYALIETKDDIHTITDSTVVPYIYTKVISLRNLEVDEKKQKFVEMLLPSILVAQHSLSQKISRIEHIENWLQKNPSMLKTDSLFICQLFDTYNCKEIQELKIRLKPHPVSIVLGQAALESGWGSSRFLKDGNNIFGIWSYNSDENRIKALVGRDSTSIYVKSYASIEDSVKDYFETIARVDAYQKFRQERFESDNPFILIPLLNRYSELGDTYTRKLKEIVESNNLTKYDFYVIGSEYFVEKEIKLSEMFLKE
ncbi:glucosaminidase domain-containing protein [Labilibaculum sp.]|uniref:glucosaminidase domain-containing protein n=1 Tax=Labilibaculum sp. TaxID=2060723 RepID=UPI0035699E4E